MGENQVHGKYLEGNCVSSVRIIKVQSTPMEVDIEKKRNRDILCIESGLDKQLGEKTRRKQVIKSNPTFSIFSDWESCSVFKGTEKG